MWSSKWTVVWKSAGSPFPGTYKQCANAPVRVGSSYRVGYYFIYFPVVVQNTGKRVVLQVDGSVEVCRVTISRYLNAPVRVGSSYRSGTTSSISPWWYKTQGSVWSSKCTVVWKSAGHHFEVPISNAPVRVGSGYRLEYYFIYFPVVVQTQGSVLSSKWTVVWKSAGSPFPGTYKQCASKSRLSL